MRRLISLILAATALAGPALAGQPVALRAAPAARGAAVTLADVFDGVTGSAAGVVVGPAPVPGTTAVLDAGRVQLAAHAAGLDWDNANGQRRIIVAYGGRAPGPASTADARRAQVLVWTRNLAAGEIVGPSDLQWSDTAIASADAPGDPDLAIGQATRRPLRAGGAVEGRDLASPRVIKRDETISVAYQAEGVSLVLQARALADASYGDRIQVQNLQSKKVIEAVASGPGSAVVGPRADSLKAQAFSPVRTASLR